MGHARRGNRAGWLAAVATACVAPVAAHADREAEPQATSAPATSTAAAAAPAVGAAGSGSLHDQLTAQLSAEADSIARALATVGDKLRAADDVRAQHLRAAARALRELPAITAPDADQLAAARKVAAVRFVLAHDRAERAQLADEAEHLRAAGTRTAADAAQLSTPSAITAPTGLAWPAHGTVAHPFGPYQHEASHAELSRRGVDLEVEDAATVVAPEAGTIIYSGPIRGLDHGLIIDAGGYAMVLAKLAEPSVPVGATVHRGDRIGRAAHHRVYFEVRLAIGAGGTPIDPLPTLGAADAAPASTASAHGHAHKKHTHDAGPR